MFADSSPMIVNQHPEGTEHNNKVCESCYDKLTFVESHTKCENCDDKYCIRCCKRNVEIHLTDEDKAHLLDFYEVRYARRGYCLLWAIHKHARTLKHDETQQIVQIYIQPSGNVSIQQTDFGDRE